MSYEGYTQVLCENGHEGCCDIWEQPYSDKWECPVCSAKAAWSNEVDHTEGSYCDCESGCQYCNNGRIDGYVELEVATPAEYKRCNLGHDHLVKEATYKIPEKGRRQETK